MIRFYHKTIKAKKVSELETFKPGSWIYVENPNEEELNELHNTFDLDLDLLEDALDPYEVPRLEKFENTLYIYLRFPYKTGEKIETIPTLIAIGKNFIATVCSKQLPFLNELIGAKIPFSTTQKNEFLLAFLSEMDEDFIIFITRMSKSIRSLRVQIENIENKDIIRFVNFEEILNDLLASLVHMNSILQRIAMTKALKMKEEHKEVIRDLILNAREMQELSKTNLRTIVNIREGYSTIMTNNLNRVIRILTVLTIILTIPTIISSVYGMNVPLPYSDSPYAFWGVLGSTGLIALITLFILIKKKWL